MTNRRTRWVFILFSALLFLPFVTHSASVSLYLNKAFLTAGDTFTASLKIDSEGTSINAAQATITYPADILEIKSVDKTNSVFNFWLEEPFFDNTAGKLSFIGGAAGGYSGRSLQILDINFQVKKSGRAVLSLTDAAVTSADGSGTNVLSALHGAEIVVAKEGVATAPATVPPAGTTTEQPIFLPPETPPPLPVQIKRAPVKAEETSGVPQITVPFYPDEKAWYNAVANFLVRWELPADVSDVATVANSNPLFNPTKSEGLFDNKFFPAMKGGVSYLHVRFKNNIGWGKTAHYRLAIDTAPPEPFSILVDGKKADGSFTIDNPAPKFSYVTSDALSGLWGYTIQLDAGMPTSTVKSEFTTSPLPPGKHAVKVGAKDNAGNIIEKSIEIDILPIEAPIITFLNKDAFTDEGGLSVGGTSLADAGIMLTLKSEAGAAIASQEIFADKNGNWNARFDEPLKKGKYYVEVIAQDERGAQSFPVKSDTIAVRTRPVLVIFGLPITGAWFFSGVIFILLLGFGAAYLSYHFWRLQLGRKVIIAERDVETVLNLVNKDVEKILKKFDAKIVNVQGIAEVKQLAERMMDNIKKMKKYVTDSISEID